MGADAGALVSVRKPHAGMCTEVGGGEVRVSGEK